MKMPGEDQKPWRPCGIVEGAKEVLENSTQKKKKKLK